MLQPPGQTRRSEFCPTGKTQQRPEAQRSRHPDKVNTRDRRFEIRGKNRAPFDAPNLPDHIIIKEGNAIQVDAVSGARYDMVGGNLLFPAVAICENQLSAVAFQRDFVQIGSLVQGNVAFNLIPDEPARRRPKMAA